MEGNCSENRCRKNVVEGSEDGVENSMSTNNVDRFIPAVFVSGFADDESD
jgi:hypothetical protein